MKESNEQKILSEQNESNEQSNERNERKNSKKRKNSDEKLFSKEDDDMIKSLRQSGKPYSEICKEMNKKIGKEKHTSKQIRQRWQNLLDPELCHKPFDEEEQEFIIQRVEEHKEAKQDGIIIINWKNLIPEMKNKFSKLRSENKIKNFYYSRKRITAGRTATNLAATTDFDPFTPPFLEPQPSPPQFKKMRITL